MVKVECESCGTEGSVDELLMCDSCGHAYHCYCLVPPLPDVPRRSWRCAKCIAKVRLSQFSFVYRFCFSLVLYLTVYFVLVNLL